MVIETGAIQWAHFLQAICSNNVSALYRYRASD